jgi:hypothetical protein
MDDPSVTECLGPNNIPQRLVDADRIKRQGVAIVATNFLSKTGASAGVQRRLSKATSS